MVNDQVKAIALAAIFTLAFAFFGTQYAGGGDYKFHFEKAKYACEGFEHPNRPESCNFYAPLFHWLAGPFTFHENAFFYFVIILLAFVTPLLLYKISGEWITVWLYYSTTSYFWFFIDGIYAQALAFALLLTLFILKDWKKQLAVVLLMTFAHGHGFLLGMLALTSIYLWKAIESDVKKTDLSWFGKIALGCSGVFGNNKPAVLDEKVGELVTTGKGFTIANLISPFTKVFFFGFTLVSVHWLLKKRKDWHFIFLLIASIVAGIFYSHRIFYMMPLVMLPALTWFYKDLTRFRKIVFVLITLGFFGFQLYSWLNVKLNC